jgi:hypothetical protein
MTHQSLTQDWVAPPRVLDVWRPKLNDLRRGHLSNDSGLFDRETANRLERILTDDRMRDVWAFFKREAPSTATSETYRFPDGAADTFITLCLFIPTTGKVINSEWPTAEQSRASEVAKQVSRLLKPLKQRKSQIYFSNESEHLGLVDALEKLLARTTQRAAKAPRGVFKDTVRRDHLGPSALRNYFFRELSAFFNLYPFGPQNQLVANTVAVLLDLDPESDLDPKTVKQTTIRRRAKVRR